MADSSSSSSQDSFFKRHWEGYKEFWGERFSFAQNYTRFTWRDEPLPSWSSSDVDEFIASDPVHGPTLKTVREATNFGLTGSAIGAVSTAGVAWKYSRSLHDLAFLRGFQRWYNSGFFLASVLRHQGISAGLSFLAGGVFGWTFGHEIANHWFQLYRLDPLAAQVKFMEWWERKCEGRS